VYLTTQQKFQTHSWRRKALVSVALLLVTFTFALHAAEATLHFDIKAQPLAEALMALGAQAGTSVIASTELTTGKISQAVSGQLNIKEALSRMLLGTGLDFEATDEGTLIIVRRSPSAAAAGFPPSRHSLP
jgi:iron complex outermembrane receptor protein